MLKTIVRCIDLSVRNNVSIYHNTYNSNTRDKPILTAVRKRMFIDTKINYILFKPISPKDGAKTFD